MLCMQSSATKCWLLCADCTKTDVLNEALNQARVEETGLNIPRVLGVNMVEGKWAIVSEFIQGKTLAQLMEEEEDEDKKAEYLELFVNLQLEMHSKTCPMLNKLKDKMNRKISQSQLDATTRYDLHTRLEGILCRGQHQQDAG